MAARTVIYARQSRDHTGQGLAVERQIEHAKTLADKRDLGTILETIVDNDVSATSGKRRAGYRRMLEMIQADQVDAIVAYHLDRLLRSLVEMEELIVLCEKHNVRIMTVAGDIDLSTDMGRLVGRILASVARGEVERKGRRQKDAAVQAATQGRAPSRGAFGHARWHRKDGERFQPPAEQIAAEAEAVRGCYEGLFAGKSPGKMADELNEAGHRTTRGGTWTRSEVRAMLLNPRNAGLRYLHGERVGKGDWPEIVPEETWQAAKALLEDPARRTSPGPAMKWLGGSLYLCGLCNESDMYTSRRDKGVRGYRCRKGMHNNRRADTIDNYVMLAVSERLRKGDVVQALAGENRSVDVAGLRTEAATLREKMIQWGFDYDDGTLTKPQLRANNQRTEARLAEIEGELADVGRGHQLAEIINAADPGQAFLDASLAVQRATLAAVCTVTVLPNPGRRWTPMNQTLRIDWTK
jgi:site-specific DNA recombinase